MLRKIINSIIFLPLGFLVTFQKSSLSENKNFIDEVIEENEGKIFIDHQEIKNIILNNNDELKTLKELYEDGHLSEEEYTKAKKKIID